LIWNHARKGPIEGTIVKDEDEWLTIRLTTDHKLTLMSPTRRGEVQEQGSLLTVRKSLLTVVNATTTESQLEGSTTTRGSLTANNRPLTLISLGQTTVSITFE
jgi:hypothetical protein